MSKKYKILKKEWEYQGFFNFQKLNIEFQTFKGQTKKSTVEVFDRGDSAAIVLYEKDTNSIILVNQFRYPTTKHSDGWIIELVAGKVEENESGKNTIKRESIEEIGYQLNSINEIGTYYLSPGGTTERIIIFYGEVEQINKIKKGGGEDGSSEDISTIKIPVNELIDEINQKRIIDAKTIIGLQWYLLNKMKNGV